MQSCELFVHCDACCSAKERLLLLNVIGDDTFPRAVHALYGPCMDPEAHGWACKRCIPNAVSGLFVTPSTPTAMAWLVQVKNISVKDFQTIDKLWLASSNGKFGYSVQKDIWQQASRRWGKFFKTIDWTVGENNVYRKWPSEFKYEAGAPRGHLPLTNALRGTQVCGLAGA
jgi:hypothetical protein